MDLPRNDGHDVMRDDDDLVHSGLCDFVHNYDYD